MIRLHLITAILFGGLIAAGDISLADDAPITLRHNPFKQPDLSMPKKDTATEKAEVEPETRAPDPVLRATLTLGPASLADIDGDIIGIGEEVNGYRLLAVNEGSAVFSKDGKRLELSVGNTAQEARR